MINKVIIDTATELGLTQIAGPDGEGLLIFNLEHMGRGCVQVKANGDLWGAWNEPWGPIGLEMALELMRVGLA